MAGILPEWVPNLHPLVVHFPIALLIAAVVFDVLSWSDDRPAWLHEAATVLFVGGAASSLVAYFTGQSASEGLQLSTEVLLTLHAHEDGALATVWFYGLFALARVGLRELLLRKRWLRIVVALVGLAGLWFVVETATHGAELVYRHGLGVKTSMP